MNPKGVFINCPFDNEYIHLLKVMVFSIIFIGYIPKLTIESSDSSQTRISKIINLISESKFGIHDLSRIKASEKGEYFRLNMPFELGLDIGNKHYSSDNKDKKILVLCAEKYDYQKALSDFSGCDIKIHNNLEYDLIKVIREWFKETVGVADIAGPMGIWNRYMDFKADLDFAFKEKGFSEEDLKQISLYEYMEYTQHWYFEDKSDERE